MDSEHSSSALLMILAIDKNHALFVFSSIAEAEVHLEAWDVQQEAIEFCDARGQRYLPSYTMPPKESRLGPLRTINIGAYRLEAEGQPGAGLTEAFLKRAAHLEHSSVPAIHSIEEAGMALSRYA